MRDRANRELKKGDIIVYATDRCASLTYAVVIDSTEAFTNIYTKAHSWNNHEQYFRSEEDAKRHLAEGWWLSSKIKKYGLNLTREQANGRYTKSRIRSPMRCLVIAYLPEEERAWIAACIDEKELKE